MNTRKILLMLTVASSVGASVPAFAGPIRREERRERRVIRRRIRRHILWREVAGRRALVVPLGVAVGEELAFDNRMVVVKEVRPETVVVTSNGKDEEIAVVKENTPANTKTEDGTEY